MCSDGIPSSMEGTEFRLPTNVVPSEYELWLEPNMETFRFPGRVHIHVDVRESTSRYARPAPPCAARADL